MSVQESTTFERLRAILAEKFEVAPELIDPAARMDQLGIDSLAVIEVIFQIERLVCLVQCSGERDEVIVQGEGAFPWPKVCP